MSRWFFRLACVPLLAGCTSDDTGVPPDSGAFLALAPDFASYCSWTSFDLGNGDAGAADDAGCVHLANVQRTAYLNKTPPHGSAQFPVGTIIVKQIDTNPPQVLAMVKRGGGYDPGSGCEGWEWFGLDTSCTAPQLQWRGVSPPASETYASCGACSSCHAAATTNDCVLAPQMSLSQW